MLALATDTFSKVKPTPSPWVTHDMFGTHVGGIQPNELNCRIGGSVKLFL